MVSVDDLFGLDESVVEISRDELDEFILYDYIYNLPRENKKFQIQLSYSRNFFLNKFQ
jgi:hypothetical protein